MYGPYGALCISIYDVYHCTILYDFILLISVYWPRPRSRPRFHLQPGTRAARRYQPHRDHTWATNQWVELISGV